MCIPPRLRSNEEETSLLKSQSTLVFPASQYIASMALVDTYLLQASVFSSIKWGK